LRLVGAITCDSHGIGRASAVRSLKIGFTL